ncbi:hypothetical protein FHB82_04660 [Escherichia coli]|nr:hypothetical protein [Escherichia coli]
MASVSISCPSCSATDGVVRNDFFSRKCLESAYLDRFFAI